MVKANWGWISGHKDQVKGETMLTGVSGQVIEMISEHYQLKKQHWVKRRDTHKLKKLPWMITSSTMLPVHEDEPWVQCCLNLALDNSAQRPSMHCHIWPGCTWGAVPWYHAGIATSLEVDSHWYWKMSCLNLWQQEGKQTNLHIWKNLNHDRTMTTGFPLGLFTCPILLMPRPRLCMGGTLAKLLQASEIAKLIRLH